MTTPRLPSNTCVRYAMPGVGNGPSNRTSAPAATNPASSADSNMYPDNLVSLPIRTLPPVGTRTCAAALARRTWGPQRGVDRSDFDLTDLVHDEDLDTCTLHVEFEGMRFKVTVEMEDWID